MLAFEGDLLGGHKIIGEGDVIDTSNRHVILRMITELRNKLGDSTSTQPPVDEQAEYVQGG
jgi:hypothetical protein